MTTYAQIENLGSSLVREYLSRKGLKDTLSAMDKESPREVNSISNRLLLAQSMHMEKLMKKNKEHPKPLRTMVEVMVKYFQEKAGFPFRLPQAEPKMADVEKVPQKHNVDAPWMEKEPRRSAAPGQLRPKTAFKESNEPSSTTKPPAKGGKNAQDVAVEDSNEGEQMAGRGYGATFKCMPKRPSEDDGVIHRTLFTEETLPSPEPRRYRGVSPEDPKFRLKPGDTLMPPEAVASKETKGENIRYTANRPSNRPMGPVPTLSNPSAAARRMRVGGGEGRGANVNISALDDNDNSNNSAEKSAEESNVKTDAEAKSSHENEKEKEKLESKSTAHRPTRGGRPTSSRPVSTSRALAPTPSSSSSSSSSSINSVKSVVNSKTLPTNNESNSTNHSLRNSGADAQQVSPSPTSSFSNGRAGSSKPSSATSSRSSSSASDKIERSTSTLSQASRLKASVEVVDELEDIEDDFEDDDDRVDLAALAPPAKLMPTAKNVKPIDEDTARSLKQVLFGASTTAASAFNEEWMRQGFGFSRRPGLEYGVVQRKGGPCGVLAAVQAALLKQMIFDEDQRWKAGRKGLTTACTTPPLRTSALSRALTQILWRAGEDQRAIVVAPTGRTHFHHAANYTADRFTETLSVNTFDDQESLQLFVQFLCESQLVQDEFPSVVLLLYSAILSRGVEKIRTDFDTADSRLMGAHSYCTQEMVNLLLCGVAASNVHNNVIYLGDPEVDKDCVKLKGLSKQNHIGFLSLFEHYGNFEVGTYYKTPLVPIWVICSESHFSVLFCLNRELVTNWKAERKFDLYYYDGLANQDEEICLSVDTTDPDFKPPDEELEMVPPLEHVIRTKWKDACVDWNGTEPLL